MAVSVSHTRGKEAIEEDDEGKPFAGFQERVAKRVWFRVGCSASTGKMLACDIRSFGGLGFMDDYYTRSINNCTRSKKSAILLSSNVCSAGDISLFRSFTSGNNSPSPSQKLVSDGLGTSAGATYANFSIFKGKAALFVRPLLPKFVKTDSGASFIDKNGSVLLSFMPSISPRKYDSQKQQTFALNPTELGSLLSLEPAGSCEFLHDPSMKSSLEGQVKKTLSVTPIPAEHGGYFFSLTVNNSILKTSERVSLPVTRAEFTVMCTAFNFILPHIIGWNQVVTANQQVDMKLYSLQQGRGMRHSSIEWNR